MALYIGNKKVTPIKVTGASINNQDKTITENGIYIADEGYTGLGTVEVQVPTPTFKTQEKTVTDNGEVTPDTGFDGLSKVTVNVEKGITPAGTISITNNGNYDVTNYANADVNVSGGGSSEWQPDPEWWDIKTILEEDTRDYAGKAIILYPDSDDFTSIPIASPCVAIGTSDGAFYTARATHYWDRTKDKESSLTGIKTRYLILYFNTSDVAYTALTNFRTASIYAIFKCNITKSSSTNIGTNTFLNNNYSLQSFDFIDGYNFNFGESWRAAFQACYSLKKLPDSLNISQATILSSFCQDCRALEYLPENLTCDSAVDMLGFCRNCYSLKKLPENIKTPVVNNLNSFCNGCYSLEKLPRALNVTSATGFSNFCQNCTNLKQLSNEFDMSNSAIASSFLQTSSNIIEANIKLPTADGTTSLSTLTNISIDSLRYIADNAPVVSSATLTIGSTNITRAGGASGYVVQTLTSKGWTVN